MTLLIGFIPKMYTIFSANSLKYDLALQIWIPLIWLKCCTSKLVDAIEFLHVDKHIQSQFQYSGGDNTPNLHQH